jgi:hypothetical protein
MTGPMAYPKMQIVTQLMQLFNTYSGEWNDECVQTDADYVYYNGTIDFGDYDYQIQDQYVTVRIMSSFSCVQDSDFCTISIGTSTCNKCTISGEVVTMEDCSNMGNFFAPGPPSIQLIEGGGYFKLAFDKDKCQHPAILGSQPPSAVPAVVDESPTVSNPSEGGRLNTFTIQPQFTLTFSDGLVGDPDPEASEILMLVVKTEEFIRDILTEDYPDIFVGVALTDIDSSYDDSVNTFTLLFTARIEAHPSPVLTSYTVLSELLSDNDNLRDYVENYARFITEGKPNGLFSFIDTATAGGMGL